MFANSELHLNAEWRPLAVTLTNANEHTVNNRNCKVTLEFEFGGLFVKEGKKEVYIFC